MINDSLKNKWKHYRPEEVPAELSNRGIHPISTFNPPPSDHLKLNILGTAEESHDMKRSQLSFQNGTEKAFSNQKYDQGKYLFFKIKSIQKYI
jgi:hypothetical protein